MRRRRLVYVHHSRQLPRLLLLLLLVLLLRYVLEATPLLLVPAEAPQRGASLDPLQVGVMPTVLSLFALVLSEAVTVDQLHTSEGGFA